MRLSTRQAGRTLRMLQRVRPLGILGAAGLVVLGAACSGTASTGVNDYAARVIGSGPDYRRVFSGAYDSKNSVQNYVAAYALGTDGDTVSLDVLTSATSTASSTLTTAASLLSVKMARSAPDAVLWIDSVKAGTGLGSVKYANLTAQGAATDPMVAGKSVGDDAFSAGIFFGATGDRVLFLSHYHDATMGDSPTPAGGQIFWWDTVSDAQQITLGSTAADKSTGNAPPGGIIMSQDGTTAIVAVDYDGDSTGALMSVDMQTGKATLIDKGVVLFAKAYDSLYASTFSNYNNIIKESEGGRLAYSVTPDCHAVAYTKLVSNGMTQQFQVFRWEQGKGAKALNTDTAGQAVATGIFPAISPSGQVVAFWDFTPNAMAQMGDVLLHVWRLAEQSDLYAAVLATKDDLAPQDGIPNIGEVPALPPIISPDDGLVVFLSNLVVNGTSVLGGELGDLWMLPVDNIPPMYQLEASRYTQHLAPYVAYNSIVFGPQQRPGQALQLTTLLTFLGRVQDLSGQPDLSGGTGSLYAVDTHAWPPTGFGGAAEALGSGIAPGDSFYLPTVNGIAYISGDTNHPYVWVPGMSIPRDLEAGNSHFSINPGTFQTFPITSDLSSTPGDAVAYLSIQGSTQWGAPKAIEESSIRQAKIVTGAESVSTASTGDANQDKAFVWAGFAQNGRILGAFDATVATVASDMTGGSTGTGGTSDMGGTGGTSGSGGSGTSTTSSSTVIDLPSP